MILSTVSIHFGPMIFSVGRLKGFIGHHGCAAEFGQRLFLQDLTEERLEFG